MKIKIADIFEGKLSEEEVGNLQKYFQEGGTWQELLEMKSADVETIYTAGYRHYEEGDFDKAIGAFSALVHLSPYVLRNWIGIGAALQGKKIYEDALSAYDIALTIDPDHIPALFYSAQCLYALNRKQECMDSLKQLIEVSYKTGTHEDFAHQAQNILLRI